MQVEFTFDNETFRHYMNGHPSVMHCHHYMALTTKLAIDYKDFGSDRILFESTEDSMRPLLDDYFRKHSVPQGVERLKIASEYFAIMGLGRIELAGGPANGDVTIHHSHVDEGWVKKFGVAKEPINHFTRGFVAAAFAAAYDKPPRSYEVSESSSIAMGATQGQMLAVEGGAS
jgi:predicted hydrocarbon binding protein